MVTRQELVVADPPGVRTAAEPDTAFVTNLCALMDIAGSMFEAVTSERRLLTRVADAAAGVLRATASVCVLRNDAGDLEPVVVNHSTPSSPSCGHRWAPARPAGSRRCSTQRRCWSSPAPTTTRPPRCSPGTARARWRRGGGERGGAPGGRQPRYAGRPRRRLRVGTAECRGGVRVRGRRVGINGRRPACHRRRPRRRAPGQPRPPYAPPPT